MGILLRKAVNERPCSYLYPETSQRQAQSGLYHRYIMDEVGSRLRSAPSAELPGFKVVPFLWSQPAGTGLLSLMWPLQNVEAGAPATREPQLGMANYNSQAYWHALRPGHYIFIMTEEEPKCDGVNGSVFEYNLSL